MAGKKLPTLLGMTDECYILSEDYELYTSLVMRYGSRINNFSNTFQEMFEIHKHSLMEFYAEINRKNDTYEWWGTQIASKSTSASPLTKDIIFLLCVRRIIEKNQKNLIFIVSTSYQARAIIKVAKQNGLKSVFSQSFFETILENVKPYFRYPLHIAFYLYKAFARKVASVNYKKLIASEDSSNDKRIVFRSWVTDLSFDESGKYTDRNFNTLPLALMDRGYDVWMLPIFFNVKMSLKQLYTLMERQKSNFILPEKYLHASDYLKAVQVAFKKIRPENTEFIFQGIDVGVLVEGALRYEGLALSQSNLHCAVIKRLKKKHINIEKFNYAFEGNTPEKQFLLTCRKYYPNTPIAGYQHTVFFPNLFTNSLLPQERENHPLPDKIICSGPIYMSIYKKVGFPSDMLEAGPNLRYDTIFQKVRKKNKASDGLKRLLLPLTFSYDLAFELIHKVFQATRTHPEYRIYIRNHPLLKRKRLDEYCKKIGLKLYESADCKTIHYWFDQSFAVLSSGGSVTILEAVIGEVPVIRIKPDNMIYYDPMAYSEYPFSPVQTPDEIQEQLGDIESIFGNGNDLLQVFSQNIVKEYFAEPNKEKFRFFCP